MIRDIHFNEEEIFDSSAKIFKYNVKNISLEYLVKVVKKATRRAIIIGLLTMYNNTIKNLKWSYKSKGNKEEI